jgi:hypothetical protein
VLGGHAENRRRQAGMKIGNLGRYRKKKYAQKTLVEFDEKLEGQCKSVEDHMFDREIRNSTLKNGEFRPPSGTLFEAIFTEIKRKEEHERHGRSFSDMISRLRTRRAKKQLVGSTQGA